MDRTNQSELAEVIRRMQRGENLERRRKRPELLDEYFRRRNALMRRSFPPPSQPVPGVSGGTPASEASQLGDSGTSPSRGGLAPKSPPYTPASVSFSDLSPNLQSRIQVSESGCWLWTSTKCRKGYGSVYVEGKNLKAHRWIYSQLIGPIPDGLSACHKCDVRNCVNPSHIFLGTNADNNRDMSTKGRTFNQKKTHCKHGHLLSPENTYSYCNRGNSGWRCCKTCSALSSQKARASKKGHSHD